MKLLYFAILTQLFCSCSSKSYATLLYKPLSERALRINPENYSEFIYCGEVCDKYVIGICWSKWRQVCDKYPFSDKVLMKQLSDAEMVLKVRAKP